jgi:hypothetical protein
MVTVITTVLAIALAGAMSPFVYATEEPAQTKAETGPL